MRILDLPATSERAITDHGSLGLAIAPVTQASTAAVNCLRLDAHGRIGKHRAIRQQLLVLVSGDLVVSGEDGVEYELQPGQASIWEEGELHESRSVRGMIALVIEGDLRLREEAVAG